MSEELDKPHLVNAALIELGMDPNFAEDGQSDLNAVVAIQWPRAVARAFGLHDWTFCRRSARLDPIAASAKPENGWAYGFAMPGDKLGGPLGIFTDPLCRVPLRAFLIEEKNLYANEPALWGRFKLKVNPVDWDDVFADAFVVLLAAMLAKPLISDADMAAELMQQALGDPREGGSGGMFGRLMAQDRASQPMPDTLYAGDALTKAHGGGSWHGG